LELNRRHLLLVCVNDAHLLGDNINTITNAEKLADIIKEIALEINTNKLSINSCIIIECRRKS